MTSFIRRLVSSRAGTGLFVVVALSMTSHSQAADLKATANQTLRTVTASAPAAEAGPFVAHHWPT